MTQGDTVDVEEKVFVFFHKNYCNIVLLSQFFLVNNNETSFFKIKYILCPSVGGRTVPLAQASLLWRPRGLNTTERA